MEHSNLRDLPDELLEAIIFYLPPAETLAFGATCRACSKITFEPLIWRRHCLQTWRYWQPEHDLANKIARPPAQTKWRLLYHQRRRTDDKAMATFNDLLTTQQRRIAKAEQIVESGYDVKALLLDIRDNTPDDAEDVLARRYYAASVLAQIHRATALTKWQRMQNRQMVRLEEVLAAYDLFVLAGHRGDMNDIDKELDRIAAAIRASHADFHSLSTRGRAIHIAEWLRSEQLVGNPSDRDYHALRNNFISIALFERPHSSLPLQSVAIYCAVARRLEVDARPSNYPHHVHAVIQGSRGVTLDGAPHSAELSDMMHMDPWRSSEEVPREQLTLRLRQMGAPEDQVAHHLGPTSNMEIAMRTSRNIMNSVQEARDRIRGNPRRPAYPDIENAWYAMLWSMLILHDKAETALSKRRQCLPYLIDHFQAHYPEDLGLIESYIVPMFANQPGAQREYTDLMDLITHARRVDQDARAPSLRPSAQQLRSGVLPIPGQGGVAHKIGVHFQHRRYGYDGIIIGWDTRCGAKADWIQQMRVDELPRGREQPFYNVLADDKSVRYVAEESIQPFHGEMPNEMLMSMAGKWFKRWDRAEGRFVSNIRDEYPDD